ncbi:hypothetical protein MMC14_002361 [Varicellaria rhodocarpa]|nr:hypothetical protein [Varicellaria rhodocarpa]
MPASSRRDIIIITTVICLLTILISFRSFFTSHVPWRPQTGSLPKFGSSPQTTDPSIPISLADQKEPVQIVSTATVSLAAPTISSVPVTTPTTPAGCEGFPDTSDILLVMKTGATEAYDKLPIHFLTTLKCTNDSILFSDMEMNIAGHHLIDTLDEVAEDVKTGNDDFDLYRTLQTYYKLREDPRGLKVGTNGWNLDKYKFLHMLLKTYRYRPDAPWYVFVEADTTLIWDNLRTFLNKFDSKKPYYIGSPTYLDIEFAHGGTGYIISQKAMQVAVGKHQDIAQKYDKNVQSICCGDAMIGRVLLDEDIKLTKAWPILNGEKPLTLPFGRNHWCQPVVSMHHLTAQEVSQVWNFEQERRAKGITKPLLFLDIFNHFVKPSLLPLREDWNNLSFDIEYTPPPADQPDKSYAGQKWIDLSPVQRSSPDSPDNCKKACEADDNCYQWMHHDRECDIGHSVKLGGSKNAEGGKKWVSGWMFERIGKFRVDAGNCTDGADWMSFA